MFTIQCTTCDAKLVVKNENTIGQILACPKCGGMVLIQKPEEGTDKLAEALQQKLNEETDIPEVFSDIPEQKTDSDIIHTDLLPPESPPQPPVFLTESELKTRKILLFILAGFIVLLIIAAGVLFTVRKEPVKPHLDGMTVQKSVSEKQPNVPQDEEKKQEEQIVPQSVPETANTEPDKKPEKQPKEEENESEKLAALLASTLKPEETPKETKAEEQTKEEIRTTTDVLSDIERKMPGLIEPSAALNIDIPQRLSVPLQKLSLQNTPLYEVIRKISALTEIPITLDIDEFRCRGISSGISVTQQLEKGTAGELLQQILLPLHLEPVIEDRQILITVPKEEKEKILEKRFDISDFVKEQGIKDFAESLRLLVNLSESELTVDGNSLTVKSRLRVLDETLRVLEQLRVIRHLPQTTQVEGELLAPEAFCWDILVLPMTLNYYQPVLLADVLEQIESKTALKILVDYKSLNRAMAPMNTLRCTVQCNRGTVNEALEKLLASAESAALTYRVVESSTIEITTKDTARQPEKMTIEVHQFQKEPVVNEPPAVSAVSPEDFVKTIRSVFEPSRWYNENEPETKGFGVVMVEKPTGCFIVRQSQPVQRQIRLYLGKKQENENIRENHQE